MELRSCNHCCHGKAILMAYIQCVFIALGIQHAMFCNIFTQGMILEKLLNIKFVFWFSLQSLSEKLLNPSWIEREIIRHVYWSSRKVLCIHVRFNGTLIFSHISKNSQMSFFMNILHVGAELFCADIRTGKHDEVNCRFWQCSGSA